MNISWYIRLELNSCSQEPQLSRLRFQSPFQKTPVVGVRSSLVRRGETSFRWTPGTIAVTLMFLEAKLNACRGDSESPVLEGKAGSPATAVVNAILRYRMWLFNLFGVDLTGASVLSNILIIQNQRLRAAGPVKVYLREELFSENSIEISVDGVPINTIEGLCRLKAQLTRSFHSSAEPDRCSVMVSPRSHTHGESAWCAP